MIYKGYCTPWPFCAVLFFDKTRVGTMRDKRGRQQVFSVPHGMSLCPSTVILAMI